MLRKFAIALVLTAVIALGLQSANSVQAKGPKDDQPAQEKREDKAPKPKLQPGWAKKGEVAYEVVLPVGEDQIERTFDGPFGPVTVIVSDDTETMFAETATQGTAFTAALTSEYSRRCKSEYWFGVSARYTIYTSFRYNFRSVTWMGETTDSHWALPAYWWDNTRTWNDWASGWKYAWGNGRATLKWGVGWLSTTTGRVHNNVLVDAWGNCTSRQYWNWG